MSTDLRGRRRVGCIRGLVLVACLGVPVGHTAATAADHRGAGRATYEPVTHVPFDEVPLYEGTPPNFKAAVETSDPTSGQIRDVSVPTLRRYPMKAGKTPGFGYLAVPGGGYALLDMEKHAGRLAERLGPLGIAVFALKYRVGDGTTDAPRDALADAERAIRLIRHNGSRWGVDPAHLGVVGYSAGSHVALNLAANFDGGHPAARDPIERRSSRPAFVASLATWAYAEITSPFAFPADVPPVFFCHAEDDATAPIALARAVAAQIDARGAATLLDVYPTGGHLTCQLGDPPMPGRDWPDKLWTWLPAALDLDHRRSRRPTAMPPTPHSTGHTPTRTGRARRVPGRAPLP